MVTHGDIARAAGVSQPTVSRALRDHPDVNVETRRRIQKLAKQMGYRPDPALTALAAYRGNKQKVHRYGKIAVLCHRSEADGLPSHLEQNVRGIQQRADALGFESEVFKLTTGQSNEGALERMLFARGIRGVIVTPFPQSPQIADWSDFAIVGIGENAVSLGVHYVSYDHDQSIGEVYRQLRARGYKNIGFCNFVETEQRNRHLFLSAYFKCRFLEALPVVPPFLYKDDTESPLDWLQAHQFDAVIGPIGLLKHVKKANLRVPEDLGVAGFGLGDSVSVDFSGHIVDDVRIGAQAVNLLQELLRRNEVGVIRPEEQSCILVRGYWREGKTVRPVRGDP